MANTRCYECEIIPPEFGYNIYQKDRVNGYGGVLLAITDRILSVDLPSLEIDCEIAWAKLNIIRSPMYIRSSILQTTHQ